MVLVSPERFGPFLVLRALGSGGMGSVFLCEHEETRALLVVKRLHPEYVNNESVFRRFVHEAEVAHHVRHENVAQLVAMGTVDREPFIAMEYVFGIPLSAIVQRIEMGLVDPVPIGVALVLAKELLSGLVAIHAATHLTTKQHLGLLHRDVGARNTLVGFDGRLRIIDLGLGKSSLSDWQTVSSALAGSPDYMAPEQALGEPVDARADVYAAAVTVWELIAGRKRIKEESVAKRIMRAADAKPEPLLTLRPDAPRSLEKVLMSAMAPVAADRLPSSAEFYSRLSSVKRRTALRASEDDVRAWLDGACATIIAKEKRALELALGQAEQTRSNRSRETFQTKVFVGDENARFEVFEVPARRAPSVLDAEPDAQPLRAASVARFAILSLLAVLVAGAIGLLLSRRGVESEPLRPPLEGRRVVEQAPPSMPSRPSPLQEGEETQAAAEPDLVAPEHTDVGSRRTRSSERSKAKRRSLAQRLKGLRRGRFDIQWQRRVTTLGRKLSSARSEGQLDEVDTQIRKMEHEGAR